MLFLSICAGSVLAASFSFGLELQVTLDRGLQHIMRCNCRACEKLHFLLGELLQKRHGSK